MVPATKERPTMEPCHPIARTQPGLIVSAPISEKVETPLTSDVAEIFLTPAGRELGHPVVLPTSCWRPTTHGG